MGSSDVGPGLPPPDAGEAIPAVAGTLGRPAGSKPAGDAAEHRPEGDPSAPQAPAVRRPDADGEALLERDHPFG